MIGALIKKLKEKGSSSCYIQCLSAVRIFSRDKNNLDMLVTDDNLKLLLKHAWLQHFAKESNEIATIQDGDTDGKLTFSYLPNILSFSICSDSSSLVFWLAFWLAFWWFSILSMKVLFTF